MINTVSQSRGEWKNLFGVCACVGEDLGFDPLWLRLAFATGILFSPTAVFVSYFALGAVVLATRLIFPDRPPAAPVATAVAGNDDRAVPERRAA